MEHSVFEALALQFVHANMQERCHSTKKAGKHSHDTVRGFKVASASVFEYGNTASQTEKKWCF